MFGLKTDTYTLNKNGNSQYELFADVSTRKSQSILVGENSGKINKGIGNSFIGYESGKQNINASFGVFVGFQAGSYNQNGNWNTFIGAYSGQSNNRGEYNTFIGYKSGELNKDGSHCTAIGINAMRENSTGNKNVAVGSFAGERILEGDENTIIGVEAGQNMRSGNLNTMAGFRCGRGAFKGNNNTYFGAYAGYSNGEGDGNAFFGYKSGEFLTAGGYNVGIGAYTLNNSINGSSNVAIGSFAGSSTTGCNNVIVGTGASFSNTVGNNNTVLGTKTGFKANGNENVFIGKSTACNLTGDRNVVIGTDALSSCNTTSSGSVVLGYNTATNTFKSGSNNIFIGIGADATLNNTSHAIAIGSCNTLAQSYSISIGETIDNGGSNSVIVGYNIYSDSDNAVSIGHDVVINNVIVFNDPLNYLFPVSSAQEYETFNLTEGYANTMYLGGISNNTAIATIYASNIYDSGNNKLKGTTHSTDINLLNIFQNNIIYQPYTLLQSPSLSINQLFSSYISNCNLIKINENTIASSNILSSATFILNNTDISTNDISIPIDISNFNGCNNSINLIPNPSTSNFNYNINIGRRILLDYLNPSTPQTFPTSIENILQQTPLILPDTRTLLTETSPTSIGKIATNITYTNKYYVKDIPSYGLLNSILSSNTSNIYNPFPEALYATQATYKLIVANNLSNITTGEEYSIIPENTLTTSNTITFTSCNIYFENSTIILHPTSKSRFDRSYLNVIHPLSNDTITVVSINSNLILKHNTSNIVIPPYTILYNTFSSNPFTVEIADINISANTFGVDIVYTSGGVDTSNTFNCEYLPNIHYPIINSNINIVADTFSLCNIIVPFNYQSNIFITTQPKYGSIDLSSNMIRYSPYTYNFGQDTFSILSSDTTGETTVYGSNYSINITTSNVFKSLTLNKMQEPVIPTLCNTVSCNLISSTISPLYTSAVYISVENNVVASSNTSNVAFDIGSYYTTAHIIYDASSNSVGLIGFPIVSCNITCNVYQSKTWDEINALYPSLNIPSNVDNGGSNYIVYSVYPPPITTTYNDLTTVDAILSINGFNTSLCNYYKSPNNGLCNTYSNITSHYENQKLYYNYASNVSITYSNVAITTTNYTDYYDNPIYSLTNTVINPTPSSNIVYTQITSSNLPILNQYSFSNIGNSNFIIPTIQLQDTLMYEYDGSYALSNINPINLKILQKDIGEVTTFHQSNISNKEIHIYNTQTTITPLTQTSNVIFNNNKSIAIKYFRNSTTTCNNTCNIDFSFENGSTNDITFNSILSNVAITHSCNIAFINPATLIPSLTFSNSSATSIIDTRSFNTVDGAFIEYIDYNNTTSIKPIRKYITSTCYINKEVCANIGFDITTIYLTSNQLQFSTCNYAPSNIYYNLEATSGITFYKNEISSLRFTQEEINTNQINIVATTSPTPLSIPFTITNTSCNILKDTQIATINRYLQNNFPHPSTSNTSCNILLHLNNINENQLIGNLWNNPNEINTQLHIIKPPINGFLHLMNTALPLSSTTINYSSLVSNDMRYIPYEPMNLVNDNYELCFYYMGVVSQTYTIPIKNYWSKWGQQSLPYSLPRSQGMIDDGIYWQSTSNNTEKRLSYQNILQIVNTITEPITQRPYFTSTSATFNVGIANYIYLDTLQSYINNPQQEVLFYITQPPTNGVILTSSFESVGHFTISQKNIFYQNFGNGQTTDTFVVRVGTSPYDLSSNAFTISLNILPNTNIIVNNYEYIYYSNINDGSNSYNLLDSSHLRLSTPTGSIFIYENSNIDLFIKSSSNIYTPAITFTNANITSNSVYYRPSSNFFQYGSNNNTPLLFKFVTNDNTTTTEPNKLSAFPIYRDIYSQEWYSKYNTFESSNIDFQTPIENPQRITYTSTTGGYTPLFNNKKCTIEFEYYAYLPSIINSSYINVATPYLTPLQTYHFIFKLYKNETAFVSIDFTQDLITISVVGGYIFTITRATETGVSSSLFGFNSWKKFYLINNDDKNNNNLSIYFNGFNFSSYLTNLIPSLNGYFDKLDVIEIATIIYGENNITFVGSSNIGNNTTMYYNLVNYHNKIQFRNFKILLEATTNLETSYNVVIGDQININGYNNVCIGKNFNTSGKGSIIVGNDIGSSSTTDFTNEIFNSIIVSTDSFTDTKVRDIIAIGRNILNNIGTGEDIDAFLAKKPVLIGNDIDNTKLDFHINFQNTFLKTNVGGYNQIYCGLMTEPLCIGYSSNMSFSDTASKLYVKGSIIQTDLSGSTFTKKQIFGNITIPTNTCTLNIQWTNEQLVTDSTFTVNSKFRFINNSTNFGYYNFENWINPLSPNPETLYILNSSSNSTVDITALTQTDISSYNSSNLNIAITWNSVSPMTYIGTLEIECIAPSRLGNIVFTISV